MSTRLDRTERLLNLLFAFMAAGQPMTRAQVRSVVAGYQDSASEEAFERMFERDKDELRSMGVPVTTVLNASGEVDGYHIPRAAYALQPIEFTPAELGALSVAAQAWDEAVFAPAATLALRKLEAFAPFARRPELPVAIAQVSGGEAALSGVIELLNAGTAMSFGYRKVGQTESATRTITPISLVSRHGQWYLVGLDHDRDDVRVFRVSRFVDQPKAAGERRDVPAAIDSAALVEIPVEHDVPGVARISLEPEQAMSLRRLGTVSDDIVTIEYTDLRTLANAVVAAGSTARVLEPAELVTEVTTILTAILSAHGGAA